LSLRAQTIDPTFEMANSPYASARPSGVVRANHACSSGLVAESVTNGSPMRPTSSRSTLAIGRSMLACKLGSTTSTSCTTDIASIAT
jgi:hypothetical protein